MGTREVVFIFNRENTACLHADGKRSGKEGNLRMQERKKRTCCDVFKERRGSRI